MLIDKGRDCDLADFKSEGWMSPLSKLSQDTSIEKQDKNPRTSLGLLKDGSFTVNVFDGRNEISEGATYRQMCRAIRVVRKYVRYTDHGINPCSTEEISELFLPIMYTKMRS